MRIPLRLLVTMQMLVVGADVAFADRPGPALSVDVAADRHAISPFIYGMAYADKQLAAEIHLPLNRWGGDATTRYNWQIDSTNAGADWYFIAGGKEHPTPSGTPDQWITDARGYGGKVMLTIPLIDYINKATAYDCSFPVSIFGPQQKTNPYVHPTVEGHRTDAGNGVSTDGKKLELTKEQILRTNMPNTPEFQAEWVKHLVGQFGTTAAGGVGVYELDNEPGGWGNTHRDVHPSGKTGHDELVSRSIAYAAAVKSVDPTAMVLGPGDFLMHYQEDGSPGDGKREHNGLGQGNYYLQQMHEYDAKHGIRLLDYFDEHYYPTKQTNDSEEVRIEATRSLWDPSYREKNWIGKWRGPIDLIPSFHKWVDGYYPGTKVGISEYGWGDMKTLTGTLIQADVLGIYGRERLDLACLFGPPKAKDPGANAFRIYLNYDGKNSTFGDTWVRSISNDQSQLALYGSQRTSDHALTLVIINKSRDDLTSPMSIAGFKPADEAKVFRYSGGDLTQIVSQPARAIQTNGFTATYPARSITLIEIPAGLP